LGGFEWEGKRKGKKRKTSGGTEMEGVETKKERLEREGKGKLKGAHKPGEGGSGADDPVNKWPKVYS
jgi:hypothetical protein